MAALQAGRVGLVVALSPWCLVPPLSVLFDVGCWLWERWLNEYRNGDVVVNGIVIIDAGRWSLADCVQLVLMDHCQTFGLISFVSSRVMVVSLWWWICLKIKSPRGSYRHRIHTVLEAATTKTVCIL